LSLASVRTFAHDDQHRLWVGLQPLGLGAEIRM